MKNVVILVTIILFLFFPLTSAGFTCSDASEVIWDQNEIEKGSSRLINDLKLGLADSDYFNVIKRIKADIFIEGIKASLTENSSDTLEFSTGTYIITLKNSTETSAIIDIEGNTKEILINEMEIINGLHTVLIDADTNSAKMVIGIDMITLSNDENVFVSYNLSNKTHIIELISASETQAIIKVSSCKSGIIQVMEEKIEKINETDNTSANETQVETNSSKKTSCMDLLEELQDSCCKKELNNDNAILNKENGECEILSGNQINQSETNLIPSQEQENENGIFYRIINWLKRLFNLN